MGEKLKYIEIKEKLKNPKLEKLRQELLEQSIIKKLETNIPSRYSISLCINRKTLNYSFKKYMIVKNEKGKDGGTDIYLNNEIKSQDLKRICDILIKLFNEDIGLDGDNVSRIIRDKDGFVPEFLEEKIINFSDTTNKLSNDELRKRKNEIEELFVFVNKVKGIDISDWNIESSVCAGNKITPECKKNLGNSKIYSFYETITKKGLM